MAYEVPLPRCGDHTLKPAIDEATMKLHHDKHHQGYVDKANGSRQGTACDGQPVLHAQREGFETHFVADAVGGATITAHKTAIQRMIQAGSQPVTLASLLLEWIRDWKTSPHAEGFYSWADWYGARIARAGAATHHTVCRRPGVTHRRRAARLLSPRRASRHGR